MKKIDNMRAANESLRGRPDLKTFYTDEWIDLVNFRVCDAAKPEESYTDDNKRCITHIYSYNKVMSVEDRAGIAKILNKTNYRILAWYFNPAETERSGLRDFQCLGRMPMHSTGGERFTVYVYFRTFRYFNGIEKAWELYDEEEEEDEEDDDEEQNEEQGECQNNRAPNDTDEAAGPDENDNKSDVQSPLLLKSSK